MKTLRDEACPSRVLLLVALAGSSAVAGCVDQVTGTSREPRIQRSAITAEAGLAATRWHRTARELVLKHRTGPLPATRVYALLSLSQHAAVLAATPGGGRRDYEAERGAVAGASAAMLAHLYPGEADFLETLLRAQAREGPGAVHPFFKRGEALGLAAAADRITSARGDGFDAVWPGSIPTGDGLWVSTGSPPAMPLLGSVRPNYLASGSQFRPGPPPTFGSAAFAVALAEVKQIAFTRTDEQRRIAQFWGLTTGTITTQGYWDIRAEELIERAGLDELAATRVFAVLDAAAMDAMIACWDAKYTYWFLRPSHADPTISLALALPSHPSYPSGHSCISGASAAILGAFFPAAAAQLRVEAVEAGRSRVYAGIHYQFDCDVGRTLGETVARYAIGVAAGTH